MISRVNMAIISKRQKDNPRKLKRECPVVARPAVYLHIFLFFTQKLMKEPPACFLVNRCYRWLLTPSLDILAQTGTRAGWRRYPLWVREHYESTFKPCVQVTYCCSCPKYFSGLWQAFWASCLPARVEPGCQLKPQSVAPDILLQVFHVVSE